MEELDASRKGCDVKEWTKPVCVVLTCATMLLVTGCASLSLFSSHHVHHHGTKEIKEKIDALEKRVDAIEKGPAHTPEMPG